MPFVILPRLEASRRPPSRPPTVTSKHSLGVSGVREGSTAGVLNPLSPTLVYGGREGERQEVGKKEKGKESGRGNGRKTVGEWVEIGESG